MIYAFDDADAELTLLPMAARRALDAVGIKLSLASYQTLDVAARRELARLGGENRLDGRVVRVLAERAGGGSPGVQVREPDELPPELASALAPARVLDVAGWQRLTGLDRYVLVKLQRAGKQPRLEQAFDEIARLRVP